MRLFILTTERIYGSVHRDVHLEISVESGECYSNFPALWTELLNLLVKFLSSV